LIQDIKVIRSLNKLHTSNIFLFLLQKLSLTLEDRDASELILVLVGYHKLLTERDLELIQDNSILQEQQQQQQQEEDHQGIY